jgi:cyclophilin family peptidyl-prolyl cis-trans isomerase
MAQVGINGDPAIQSAWRESTIQDDTVKESNKRGFVTFAQTRAPHSRSTQFFINFSDANATLDKQGFAPFGEVAAPGMDVVDTLYSGYGEGAPSGSGPEQAKLQSQGHAYLLKEFPKLDYIKKATIRSSDRAGGRDRSRLSWPSCPSAHPPVPPTRRSCPPVHQPVLADREIPLRSSRDH